MRSKFIVVLCLILLAVAPSFGQKKTPSKNAVHTKTQIHSNIQPRSTTGIQKKTAVVKQPDRKTVTNFTPEQTEQFRQQAGQLVQFFQGTLNFLADKKNTVKDKEVIITQSYLKTFWDSKVQVEDDLDEKRLVPLYKDIPAYLTDVDFFFKRAHFQYIVQTVDVMTNDDGQTYFKVTANRNLTGLTVNGDSVNSNKVRYFEINYDDSKKELKIVSIYTTKLNEKDDIRNWWNGLSPSWQALLGKDQVIDGSLNLGQVTSFQDSVATVNGEKVRVEAARVYGLLFQLANRSEIDISNNESITSLDPLGKLSSLKIVNVSNTSVSDLMPLRNLNHLESLDISGTKVTSLEPLRYASNIRELKMKGAPISDIGLLSGFPALEVADISNLPISSLESLKDMGSLKDLRLAGTQVADLGPLAGLSGIELLDFSSTPVTRLDPLKDLSKLRILIFNRTGVSSLSAIENISSLQKIYCDNTKITLEKALEFMKSHPDVTVIFESEELTGWWNGLSPEWKKIFPMYSRLDDPPTQEQLHRLITVDSINITGRMSVKTLDPLKKLSQLRSLDMASTSVTDLAPLSGLLELKRINAANTGITGIDPLSGLKNLEWLNVDNSKVKDLSPLEKLDKLRLVFADNTGVALENANALLDKKPDILIVFQTYENTGWWNNLPQEWKEDLSKQMGITGTPDKNQLQQIVNLETLVIREDARIFSLQSVTKFSRLRELECSDTRITDLLPLTRLPRLLALRIPKNPVNDLSAISTLTNLKELDISNTQVENLEPIQNLTGLEILKFSGTPVKNLKYLQRMTGIKTLEFYNTKVSNLDVLDLMRNLKSLKIFNTKISAKRVEKFKLTHPGCDIVYY